MGESTRPLTFTAAGDAMITTRLTASDRPEFEALIDRIRETDAAMVNLEVLLHEFDGYPAANGPGTYMQAPPSVADELTDMGFDLFSAATNHAIDYSHGGMEATMDALDERAIPYAGFGRTLADARAPVFAETEAGRVGLVAACSTVTTGSAAGRQRHDMVGRPGISPLRHDVRYRVPDDAYDSLQDISEQLGLERYKDWYDHLGFPIGNPDADPFRLIALGGDTHPGIERADDFGIRRVPNPNDVEEYVAGVRRAKRQADWVIASLHSHEGDGAMSTDESVAPFIEDVARECIDAGADAFVGHGAHTLRGIELYDGAPIFYSLGNFVAQNELIDRLPTEVYDRYGLGDDATPMDVYDARAIDDDGNPAGFLSDRGYFETVLPVCEFDDDGVRSIELHPVDLQFESPRSQRGRPILADESVASGIFDRLQDLSAPYGTELIDEGGVGRIVVDR